VRFGTITPTGTIRHRRVRRAKAHAGGRAGAGASLIVYNPATVVSIPAWGENMRLLSSSRTAALALLALGILGCASAGSEKPMKEARLSSGQNNACSWTLERGPSGRVIAESVRFTSNPGEQCRIVHSGNRLFIGDTPNHGREILDIDPGSVEFLLKGSCQRCYLNSVGGLTCIVWNC
jgi:hypothetical protein